MSWDALAAELARWRAAGRTATFWWRDDDAVADTEALRRLVALRAEVAAPLALAVIPAGAEASLADRLAGEDDIAILQHGFAHRNHANVTPRAELGGDRDPDSVAHELTDGWDRLTRLFGSRPLRVVVPPWNRIAAPVIDRLPGLGYRGLSTFKARARRFAAAGLVQANTHVDIVDWTGTRGFVGTDAAVGAAVNHLMLRRTGAADPDEPTGLLTHHLAHDAACWNFVRDLALWLRREDCARWLAAPDVFAA